MVLLKLIIAITYAVCSKAELYSESSDEKRIVYLGNASEEVDLTEVWGGMWPFQGINTFAHLEYEQCLIDRSIEYDIGIIGVPFDTATTYRPGARFGPRAIRSASQRQTSLRGYNYRANMNPYLSWAKILDCGDMPITPMDNALAFKQMTMAFEELLHKHKAANISGQHPRLIALGGDHSILLPHIRALHKIYGPVNVLHFDAHLDTWAPDKYPSYWSSKQSEINHGSMLWKAYKEGLTSHHNVHAGLRTRLSGAEDLSDDNDQHFTRIDADDIWLKGPQYVIDKIYEKISCDTPTYISVDIDTLDPGFGSGTGTQEPGGWLPRELIHILRGISNLSIVGADIVEVAPAFDNAEITATNGAQIVYEILTSMVSKGSLEFGIKEKTPRPSIKVELGSKGETNSEQSLDQLIEMKLNEFESIKAEYMRDILELRSKRSNID